LTVADSVRLREKFKVMEHRIFPTSPDVNNFFERMLHEHRLRDDPNSALMARLMFHSLLIVIIRDHDRYKAVARQKPMITWRIRQAREWLDEERDSVKLELDELAKKLKTSPSNLRYRFKLETGETPHDYWQRCKLEEARRRLVATDQNITELAHELGFSSSQYFATVFRQQTGLSPGDFRLQKTSDDPIP
jgi:AraC-like DNA-binding protein